MLNYKLLPTTKYTKHYIKLMETRKFQLRQKFKTERHHIFPVSIFNKNKFTVNLTCKEHYIAHMLLWKIYRYNNGADEMMYAFKAMFRKSKRHPNRYGRTTSRIYSILREETARLQSERMKRYYSDPENRKKFSERLMKQWKDPVFRANQTKHNQNYWSNPQNRKQQSKTRKNHLAIKENYDKMVEANRKLTSKESWRKQRSEKQKELHKIPGYTQKRINAMNTLEANKKQNKSLRKTLDNMTAEERRKSYARIKTREEYKAHGDKIRGRKSIINVKTKQRKVVKLELLSEYLDNDWVLGQKL